MSASRCSHCEAPYQGEAPERCPECGAIINHALSIDATPDFVAPSAKYVWLAEHFSVPMDTLCMTRAPAPNSDHFCLKAKGHPGQCEGTFCEQFKVRAFSHKDGQTKDDAHG